MPTNSVFLYSPNYSPVFELRLVNPSLPEHLKCMGIFCLKFKSSNIEVPEESIGKYMRINIFIFKCLIAS